MLNQFTLCVKYTAPDGVEGEPGLLFPSSATVMPPHSHPNPKDEGISLKLVGTPQRRADWGSGCGRLGREH